MHVCVLPVKPGKNILLVSVSFARTKKEALQTCVKPAKRKKKAVHVCARLAKSKRKRYTFMKGFLKPRGDVTRLQTEIYKKPRFFF